jgi:hypothetical protein
MSKPPSCVLGNMLLQCDIGAAEDKPQQRTNTVHNMCANSSEIVGDVM